MIYVATFGISSGVAVVAVVAAIVAAIAAIRKMGPEKDALYITSVQGATVIMDNLVDTLRGEIDRCRARIVELEEEIVLLEQENRRLKDENKGLVRRHGSRLTDKD